MKISVYFVLLMLAPLLAHATQLSHPVTVTGEYSLQNADPRFEERQFYKFEIKLDQKGRYAGTIERPVIEYVSDGLVTSEVATLMIEVIEGRWFLDMKTIVIGFPHIQNLKEIEAKSSNKLKVKLKY